MSKAVSGLRRGAPAAQELPGGAASTTTGAAIRTLGTPDFPAAFARMAANDFLADQVVVFRTDGRGRICTLLAQNLRDGAERARALAESYAARHWAQDPNRPLLAAGGGEGSRIVLRAIRVEEIADAEYRCRLFIEPRLGAKAALVVRAPNHALYVNLYRGLDRQPFGPGELAAVQRVIVEAATESGGPPLSEREAAVCARIAAGCSAEGIGLDPGVSTHSVVTYRRRAFQKLGIATQKELFAVVLRRHRVLGG
jgi:DNA-binding CsgD family transcriptional regulator